MHRVRTMLGVAGLCLSLMTAHSRGYGQAAGPTQQKEPSGPSTSTYSSPIASAQQSLYTASGQNGATPTDDSFHGSVVTGKATEGVMDLSLDDAIQRGLRQNLGLILQTSSVKNSNGQRLEELQALPAHGQCDR